jgi:hypothetical protein
MEYHLNSNGQGYPNGYEGEDSGTSDPEDKFYRNYFLCVLDQGILSVEQTFKQLAEHNNNFGFLCNIETLRSMTADNLKNHCMNLDLLLEDGDKRQKRDGPVS